MKAQRSMPLARSLHVVAAAALLSAVASFLPVSAARSAEIVPSIGMTRAVDGDGESRFSAGLALRGSFLPLLKNEIAISYRSESRFDGALVMRTYPVTASLWLTPIPTLYVGGGVGYYNTTFDFDQDLVPFIDDETRQEFGIHLGGGLRVPVAPAAALDLQGRYVMMRDQESRLVPESFDPDFWSLNLGLAFGF